MFFTLIALTLSFYGLLGIGMLTSQILRFDVTQIEEKNRIAVWGIWGLASAGTVSSVMNFFLPISPTLSFFFLLIGLSTVAFNFKILKPYVKNNSFRDILILTLFLSLIISSAKAFFLDTAIYHLQAIRWITESKTPLGLANLIGKLGFNSIWFPTAAILESFGLSGKSSFLLNPILFLYFCSPLSFILRNLKKSIPPNLSEIFLLTCILSFSYPFFIEAYIVSPSNDAPVMMLGLFIFYLLLHPKEKKGELLIFLAIYAFTVKLSAFPLLLIIPIFFLKEKGFSLLKLKNWRIFTYTAVLTLSWLLRGLYSSGCLFYPKMMGCLHKLEWTVPLTTLKGEYDLIKSWARKPYLNPNDQVLESWDWFKPWLIDLMQTPSYQIAFFLISFGAIGVCLLWRSKNRLLIESFKRMGSPLLISSIGIIFWFSIAPAPRFGLAFIYGFASLLFAVVIHVTNLLGKRNSRSLYFLTAILILLLLPITQRMKFDRTSLFLLPKHPEVKVSLKKTNTGGNVLIPQEGFFCWNAELPCGAIFKSDLNIKTHAEKKQPFMFYYDKAFKDQMKQFV